MDMDALLLVKPVCLVYCNMFNVSKLVSVGRFNIQTNNKIALQKIQRLLFASLDECSRQLLIFFRRISV